MGRRKNMEDETVVVLDVNAEHELAVEKHGALSLIVSSHMRSAFIVSTPLTASVSVHL